MSNEHSDERDGHNECDGHTNATDATRDEYDIPRRKINNDTVRIK